jgi:hypothetical protein
MLDIKKSCEHIEIYKRDIGESNAEGWCLDCVQKLFSCLKAISNLYHLPSIQEIVQNIFLQYKK